MTLTARIQKYFVSLSLRSQEIIFLVGCIIYGGYLRFYELGASSSWMDEGYTTLATMMLALHGKTMLLTGDPYSCGTYCALSLPFVSVLGSTPTAMRLVAALAGTLVIPVVYFLAKKFFSLHTAYVSTLFITLSYIQIAWSRQARWYTLLELFSLLAIFFFLYALRSKQEERTTLTFLTLSLLFSFLTAITHPTGLLVPLILAMYIAIDTNGRTALYNSTMRLIRPLRYAVVFAIIVVLLFVLYRLSFFALTAHFFNLFPYYAYYYGSHYYLFFLSCIPLFFFVPKEKHSTVTLLSCIILAYLLSLSYLSDTLHYRYFFIVTPLIVILGSYGVTLFGARRATLRVALPLLFLTFLLLSKDTSLIPRSFYALESDSPDKLFLTNYYAYTPQPDWQGAYSFIRDSIAAGDIVIASHPHFTYLYLNTPGYWFPMNYLDADTTHNETVQKVDSYVGALPVENLHELEKLIEKKHGYVIYDYQASDGRIAEDTLRYIHEHMTLVFSKETNEYSKVWVYKF